MSERKVLNKYYPPDFDPTKLAKLRLPKQRQYTVRIMTPFNMKCNTCGDYIAKAKKFNARKETIENQNYLNLKIFRFYIKCPKCMSEITFKTNPETCDYEMEFGAHRNFDALRLAELQEQAEIEREKEEEKLNPMKLLENRTKQSREEMEELEKLQQLKEENVIKQGVDVNQLIEKVKCENDEQEIFTEEKMKQEDEILIKKWLKKDQDYVNEKNEEFEKINLNEKNSNKFFTKFDRNDRLIKKTINPENQNNIKKLKLNKLVIIKKKDQNEVISTKIKDHKIIENKLNLCGYTSSDDSSNDL